MVCVRFPYFVFMEVVKDDDPQSWVGTEVQAISGASPVNRQLPQCFKEYFVYKIRKAHEASQSLNEK